MDFIIRLLSHLGPKLHLVVICFWALFTFRNSKKTLVRSAFWGYLIILIGLLSSAAWHAWKEIAFLDGIQGARFTVCILNSIFSIFCFISELVGWVMILLVLFRVKRDAN